MIDGSAFEDVAEARTLRRRSSRVLKRRFSEDPTPEDVPARRSAGSGTPKTEKQKILLKRLKNKEAAARCRQKKIDTIKRLERLLEVSHFHFGRAVFQNAKTSFCPPSRRRPRSA
jgi:hypothetical protein